MANHITRIRDQYEADLANANRTRATAIAELSRTGTPQTDIIKGTSYSRETVRKLIAEGLTHLADGSPLPDPGPCGAPCSGGHMYEGDCVVSPMIIGTISPRMDNGITVYSWRCDWDHECGLLRHLGYSSAAAARRAYDRHSRAEHGDLSPRAK